MARAEPGEVSPDQEGPVSLAWAFAVHPDDKACIALSQKCQESRCASHSGHSEMSFGEIVLDLLLAHVCHWPWHQLSVSLSLRVCMEDGWEVVGLRCSPPCGHRVLPMLPGRACS